MNQWKTVEEKAKEWLELDPFESSQNEIKSLLEEKNEAELSKRLLKRINFGTAGLRSRMGAGFAYMNDLIIIQTTQVHQFN
jgi:phosphomannomutase